MSSPCWSPSLSIRPLASSATQKANTIPMTTYMNPLRPAKTAPAPLFAPFLPAAALQGLPAVPPAFGLVALLEAPIVAWHH